MRFSSFRDWRRCLLGYANTAGTRARSLSSCKVILPCHGSSIRGLNDDDPAQERLAKTYLKGMGGLVGFELKQGHEAGARFIDALKLFYHVANIGDARSLAIYPASTTHSQLSPAHQLASGVTPGYVPAIDRHRAH